MKEKILIAGEFNTKTGKIYYERKCDKCLYKWYARVREPRQCPNCKQQIKYPPSTHKV